MFADDLAAVTAEWSTPPNPPEVVDWAVVVSAAVLGHRNDALPVEVVGPEIVGRPNKLVVVVVALAVENNVDPEADVAVKPAG